MSKACCEELQAQLQRLEGEQLRLTGESQRLRSQVRKARASASIASSLHQELFCSQPRAPATASECGPSATSADDAAALVTPEASSDAISELHAAEALTLQREAEVVELKKKLASQEALQAQTAQLVATLDEHNKGLGRADNGASDDIGPVSSREARLARETTQLRQRVRALEQQVQQMRAADTTGASSRLPGSGRQTPLCQRDEIRRLQQLDRVNLKLHEELQRCRPRSNCPSAASSPPRRLPVGQASSLGQALSQCGTSFSKLSVKSEMLEQQLEAFRKRYMVRRSGLVRHADRPPTCPGSSAS